jgi:hypothetical protein
MASNVRDSFPKDAQVLVAHFKPHALIALSQMPMIRRATSIV